jgi:Fic family protein
LYFKTHRQEYYDLLQLVRETGNWEEWIQFFLKGVHDTANQAVESAQMILRIFEEDRKKIEAMEKSVASALIIHHNLQKHVITDAKKMMTLCKISLPTVNKVLRNLVELGIVREATGNLRNKVYVYQKYLNVLSEGAEPIKS